MTLILFTTIAPDLLTDGLSRQGYRVYEALAISEVLSLIELHPAAAILIAADVDPARAKVIQQHYPTLHLGAATVADVIWELGRLSPRASIMH